MNKVEALTLLGLPQNAEEIHIEETIESRLSDLRARITQASSESLRNKFEQNLELLQQAKSVLIGAVTPDLSSLPVSAKHAHHIQSSVSESIGKYKIEKQIGKTQDVLIFSGQDSSNGDQVEIVRIQRQLSKSEQRDLEHQFGELSRIQSDCIQGLLDFEINEDGSAYFVLEAVDGEPLDNKISSLDKKEQKRIIFDLCYCLGELHRFRSHGRLALASVMIGNGKVRLVRIPVAGLELTPGNHARFGNSKATIQNDIMSLASIIVRILNASLDANTDLATAAKSCAKPVRKVLLSIASGDRDKSPATISELTSQLKKAFSPSLLRGLQSPVFRFAVIPLLILVMVIAVFKNQVSTTWEDIRPMSSDEKQILSDGVIQGITRVETLLANYERSLSKLEQEIDRLTFQIEQIKIKGGDNKKLIAGLEESLNRKRVIMDIAEEGVVARTQLPTLKGEVSVIKQHLGDKDFEGAKLLLSTIEDKMGQTNNLIKTLESLQNERERLKEFSKKLKKLSGTKLNSNTTETIEGYTLTLESHLKAGKFQQAMSEGLKPLIKLHVDQIYKFEQKSLEASKKQHKQFVKKLKKSLVKIPAGSYKMGVRKAGFFDARPVHNVNINTFYMSKYPVTNSIYKLFKNKDGKLVTNKKPVTKISWHDALKFSEWLGKQIGRSCRLPTESEWEYAAKGGTTTHYPWGNGIGVNQANCKDCSSRINGLSGVDQYKPNQYGLHDMQGNVWEWTQDCYTDSYRGSASDGSAVDFDECKRRVLRGGAWNSSKKEIHPSYRNAAKADFKSDTIGFRFVCN